MNRSHLLRGGLVAVAAGGLAALFVLHGPNWGEVGAALASMSWSWALVGVGLNLGSALLRALAWRTVLTQALPPPHPRVVDVLSAFFVGIFANGVLPGRVGEIARVGVLARRLPSGRRVVPSLVGSVLAYRLLEILPSLVLIVWVLLQAKVPRWGRLSLLAVLAGGLLLLLIGVVLARHHEMGVSGAAGRLRALVERIRHGLGVLRRPQPALLALLLQALAWGFQLAAVWAVMRAFGIRLPLIAAGLVLALMNVALLVPLWPGNVGLQQAAIALPLVAYGIAYARGFAYGIGLQAVESSVGYVFGVIFLLREGLSIGRLRTAFVREATASDHGGS